MATPLETYRVSAYNTSRQSENKIHDDAVARKFGFSGGLVPGVDVLAYMIHLPVAKWGRAFLERGLIEARFTKPVYDGEFADVTASESDGVLSIEVESKSEHCATGTASLPASVPSLSLSDYSATPAVTERRACECQILRTRQVAWHDTARLGRRSGRGISDGYSRGRSDLYA